MKIIAITTLFFAFVLFFSDQQKTNKNISLDLNLKSILFIGLFQILALVPGVSRAGITITAARFLKFNRFDSSKIAFLLSIPALTGASLLGLKDALQQSIDFSLMLMFGVIFSFIFSFITIKYFLQFIKKFSLNVFVAYRVLISFFILFIIYF